MHRKHDPPQAILVLAVCGSIRDRFLYGRRNDDSCSRLRFNRRQADTLPIG
jgi:hypothetical protein